MALVLDLFHHEMRIIVNPIFIVNLESLDWARIHIRHLKTRPCWGIPYFGKVWTAVKNLLLELAKITKMYEALLVLSQFIILHLNLLF